VRGSIDQARRWTVGSRPHGRRADLAKSYARSRASEDGRGEGPARARSFTRMPSPRNAGASSRGEEKAQESTDQTNVPWPGWRSSRERTLEGSKASKWACRPPSPASPTVPRSDLPGRACVSRTTSSGSGEPSSQPPSPVSPLGEPRPEVGATGKGAANPVDTVAPLGGRTRTHKEAGGPRERVRLLEKGKL